MQDKEPDEFRDSATLKNIWLLFRQNRIALFSFYLFVIFILTALFSPWIAPYPSNMQFVGSELMPPSWVDKGQISFFFGTDDLGRDVFSRIIIGTTYTIGASLIVVFFTLIIGSVIGIWAGISHSIKSKILSHFLDTFLSIPSLLIAIIIATLMKPSLMNAIIATTLALLPYFIHEIYQATQQELKKEYVLMLKLDGISNSAILKEIVLPNISIRYIQEIARAFAVAILDISALSFISLGAQRPVPEWGAMIKDSLELIYLAPWAVILPGIAIVMAILVVFIFSQGLCKAIEKYYE
ncbi:peptide transport system permease protein SapC [Pasteurella canis]|uniref:ABC transporter permease subunit n=1 Tax=Pasteurella canis TaxID=753 RepID=UPI001E359BB6|nr:ABC transporter permease subunit [Pasteurella canis]GJJ80550.1 peptide transport system permease protein SapC [Pasteurella canis]